MYARLVEFSGAGTDKREQIIETVQETVIPMLRRRSRRVSSAESAASLLSQSRTAFARALSPSKSVM